MYPSIELAQSRQCRGVSSAQSAKHTLLCFVVGAEYEDVVMFVMTKKGINISRKLYLTQKLKNVAYTTRQNATP